MSILPLDAHDLQLFEVAKAQLEQTYHPQRHVVAAALRTTRGVSHKGLHIGSRRLNVCAESSAIANAAMTGDEIVATVVAVTRDDDGRVIVTNPCGMCREMLSQYGPEADVLVDMAGEVRKVPAATLMPNPWRFPHETQWRVEDPAAEAKS